jgi:hypothetical protein
MPDSHLLFRRQFLMTPEPCPELDHWQQARVGGHIVYAHPDVQLTSATAAAGGVTAVAVGFMLDPEFPARSNAEVLQAIADMDGSVERISRYLDAVSGRFVLIVATPDDVVIFHDPCGFRTVCYTTHGGRVFAGSQPLIFKLVMPLGEGERFESYTQSDYVMTHREHWIPSGCTLFEGVSHLVPNHYLRLSTLEQTRYWPRRPLVQQPAAQVATQAAGLLQRLMLAADTRFPLALPLTAGWDSRTILGASRAIAGALHYFTLQYRDLHPGANDIRIPARLLQALGLRHQVIDCNRPVPEWFQALYEHHVSPVHMDDYGLMAYAMFEEYPARRVCIKGNCSEIARCFYYKNGTHPAITSPHQIVARVKGWHSVPLAQEQVTAWYEQAHGVAAEANVEILDLFYWEHRMGSWQAFAQVEWDIVQDAFTPFNHRGLLELLLSTSAELRCAPNYPLYRMIIESLWPEVLSQPVNPLTARERLQMLLGKRHPASSRG